MEFVFSKSDVDFDKDDFYSFVPHHHDNILQEGDSPRDFVPPHLAGKYKDFFKNQGFSPLTIFYIS